MSLQTSILTRQEDKEYDFAKQLKKEHQEYEERFTKLKEELQFIRHEGQHEEELYSNRNINTGVTKQ